MHKANKEVVTIEEGCKELDRGAKTGMAGVVNPRTIDILERHNQWRRGAEIEPTDPKLLGEAIDDCIRLLKQIK